MTDWSGYRSSVSAMPRTTPRPRALDTPVPSIRAGRLQSRQSTPCYERNRSSVRRPVAGPTLVWLCCHGARHELLECVVLGARARAAAGMGLLSVVLTACGSASPSAHEGDGEGSIRSASIERELALLVHDLEGGRAAWDTRAWIAYHGIQDAIATCMARDGLSYPVAPAPLGSPDAPDAPVDWTPGLAPLGWLRGTMTKDAEFQAERSRTSGADVWPREGANPVYLRLSVADRVRYDQALTACSTEANSKATGLGELGPVGSRLRGELSDGVSSALDNLSITSLRGAAGA